jgi:hypothetical protein
VIATLSSRAIARSVPVDQHGIQAWTFPVHEPIAIRWHDFSVHRSET